MPVHFHHNTAVIRSLQCKDQFYFDKHRSVIQNFHIRKVTLILLCVKSADISSDQTAFRINTLPYFGAFINRREERFQTGFAHFNLCFFIVEGGNALSDFPFDLKEIVFQTVRQFVTFRIVRVHNITYRSAPTQAVLVNRVWDRAGCSSYVNVFSSIGSNSARKLIRTPRG